jgi:predicted GIY-YIG superfamily endonuclease
MKQSYDLFEKDSYKHLKMSCVYKLSTPHNNLCYIGSTINYAKRMKDHRNDLIKKRHVASYLQNVVSKYSKCYTEILECVKESQLLDREKFYIDKFKPRYNTIKDPTTQLNNNATSIPVHQYGLDGVYIRSWKSVNEVNRKLDIQVSPSLDKDNRSAGKYQWRTFKTNNINSYKPNQGVENIIHVYDILGKYIESLTMYEIQEKYYPELTITQVRNKVNNQCVNSKSINRLRFSKVKVLQLDNSINKTHKKGYIILQYDSSMNYINAYDSIQEAQRQLNIKSIYDNIIGKTRLVNKQYIFKILDGPVIQ